MRSSKYSQVGKNTAPTLYYFHICVSTKPPLVSSAGLRSPIFSPKSTVASPIMEDEEEIQSHPPPNKNGRIFMTAQPVTVAAAPPPHTLTLALPIQQPRTAGGGGGGREDCWSKGATSTLIDAWGERYLELSRGNLKQQHWKDVADVVSSREDYTKTPKTDVQCKNRIDTLKKKYKLEKAKMIASSGEVSSNWPFFHRLDLLIGPNSKITGPATTNAPKPTMPVPSAKLPVAIPVGPRRLHKPQQQQQQQQKQQPKRRRPGSMDSMNLSGSDPAASPDSTDSFPPDTFNRKRPRFDNANNPIRPKGTFGRKRFRSGGWENSIRELTGAILEFGEAYERAKTSKLQLVVEMETQRMRFVKDLELQRMQFLMKTQLELTQLKHGRRRIGNSHHRGHNHNNNNRNNSA